MSKDAQSNAPQLFYTPHQIERALIQWAKDARENPKAFMSGNKIKEHTPEELGKAGATYLFAVMAKHEEADNAAIEEAKKNAGKTVVDGVPFDDEL